MILPDDLDLADSLLPAFSAFSAPSLYVRYRVSDNGGHMHVRMFVSTRQDGTYALAGTFVLRHAEFESFKAGAISAEFCE